MRKYLFVRWVLLFMLMGGLPDAAKARVPDEGHGVVGMKGSIIDTPCAIAINDQAQTVTFGTQTTGELIHDGHGPLRPFHIHLVNCSLGSTEPGKTGWSGFQVTFDGDPDGELFGIHGASGVAVKITDQDGNRAIPGLPLPWLALKTGDQTLNFYLQLVGDRHRLRAGDYRTTVRFKVDYF